MRNRKVLLLLLVVILIAFKFLPTQKGPAVQATVAVLSARENIEPYTFISASQVSTTTVPSSVAGSYYSASDRLDGYMATTLIKKGSGLTRANAQLPEEFRFWGDMGLEVGSFKAAFSEMVGGQVRPGHRINVYAYRKTDEDENNGDLVLVASNILVVGVRTETGEEATAGQVVAVKTPTPGSSSAPLSFGSLGGSGLGGIGGAQPASVIVFAAEPRVAQGIIAFLGSRNYSAWVTLAPQPAAIVTPLPVPTMRRPSPTPQPTSVPPTQGATSVPGPTLSVISGSVYMSVARDGPPCDKFINATSMIWAVVALNYAPAGPIPITIEVTDQNRKQVFRQQFTHPAPGKASHLLEVSGGFPANSVFTTTVTAGGAAFQVKWETTLNSPCPTTSGAELPNTGN
jgi:hypothetical protein